MPKQRPDEKKLVFRSYIKVRPVDEKDIADIYQIASSVGKGAKDSNQGFLVDDYASDREYYVNKFLTLSKRLSHFYVAENVASPGKKHVVGFLIAYTREQWLEDNPDWIKEVNWHPDFDADRLKSFVVIDKTAIPDRPWHWQRTV